MKFIYVEYSYTNDSSLNKTAAHIIIKQIFVYRRHIVTKNN